MEQTFLRWLPPRPQSFVVRYSTTAVLVGVGFLALVGLEGRGGVLGFYLLFPAIFAASVLFSRGTGIFAVALSCLLLYLFLKPAGSMWLAAGFIFPLAFFALLAVGLAIVSEALRTAWEHAVDAERA